MTQAKHTPGPWVVERTSHKDVSSARARFEVRTPSRPFDGKPFGNWVAGDVREADARLIAATPELLAACWEAINALDLAARFCPDDAQDGRPLSIRAQVIHERELIMAAIRKAEGADA